ncbi:MAG: pantoate--beta-alanine ligase [Desulfovibrio sp.]|nr:pantoate--beta-alanine ligase [Desulfovibrio sp.]
MHIIKNLADLSAQCRSWHNDRKSICLVPTMGYYHAGHEDLMAYGRTLADKLVVSLFVNPTQFGPAEDLASYPQDHERDARIAESHGCDVLFLPEAQDMYTQDHATWVEVPKMAKVLCGVSRPIHFRGVCTVVLKLFNLTQADFAVFGEKDWQQQAILKKMCEDLNVPVKILTRATVRENDGLALSSRNVYLTPEERRQAPAIYAGLCAARNLAAKGERNAKKIKDLVLQEWAENIPLGRLDYLTIVDPHSLESVEYLHNDALMACAIRLGKARLIDNILLPACGSQA